MPPVFAAAFTAIGVTGAVPLFGSSVALSSILGNVAFTAALMGAQYALAAQNKPKISPFTQTISDPLTPRFHVLGRQKVSGFRFFRETSAGWLGIGQVLNCGRIDGVESLTVDSRAATEGDVTDDLILYTESYGSLEIANATAGGYHSGVLPMRFGEIWDGTHLGKNITCLYGLFPQTRAQDRNYYYPNGIEIQIEAIVRGEPVFDPRDEAQDVDDPATWLWSDNPALLAAYVAMHEAGLGLDPSWIDWDTVAAAADACDATTSGYGGSSAKFARAATIWSEKEETRNVIARLLACCDGSDYINADGDWCIRVGAYTAPVVTFTDRDLIEVIEDPYQAGKGRTNLLRPKWMDPANNYDMVDAPVAQDAASIAIWGEEAEELSLPACPNGNQAYRIAMRGLKRLLAGRAQVTLGPRGLLAVGQETIRITSVLLGFDKVFDVIGIEPSKDLASWNLALRETSSAIYANEVPPANPAHTPPTMSAWAMPAPTLVALTSVTIGGGKIIRLEVDAADDPSYTLVAQYKPASGSTWFDMSAISATIAQTGYLAAGAYDVQWAWRNGIGQMTSGAWPDDTITIT